MHWEDISVARAAEEMALPLPGKNSCHVGGIQRAVFLNNTRKMRKQDSVILSESKSLERCPTDNAGTGVAFWTAALIAAAGIGQL